MTAATILSLDAFTHPAPGLRLAVIGTWPPRRCGIATFTADTVSAIRAAAPHCEVDVYAMVRSGEDAPDAQRISQDDRPAHRQGGLAIEAQGYDAVWLQHEFGIFGGSAGDWVIDLLAPVSAPLIVTLHTVLENPDPDQERVMAWLAGHASRLIVMSRHAARILRARPDFRPGRDIVIEHGVPDRPLVSTRLAKEKLGLPAGPIMLTFGLLCPGKGIEIAIAALARIVAAHPDVTYIVAGITHPELVAREGESYRARLKAQARDLGVEQNLLWLDEYRSTGDLLDLIAAADIYLTPYTTPAQTTSGTLSYAVALGKAVVSTPFAHAAELLGNDIGVLTPFGDDAALAAALCELLSDNAMLTRLQHRAYQRGRTMIWPRYAARCLQVITALRPRPQDRGAPVMLGEDELERLCDDTGIYQHSVICVPDRRHGYCVDDNARALMLANVSGGRFARRALVFAAFVQQAWHPERRRFRNFMRFDRSWSEECGSLDSNGRVLWALGATASQGGSLGLRTWAAQLWDECASLALELAALRAQAFAVLGADLLLHVRGNDPVAWAIMRRGLACLSDALAKHSRDGRIWFEPQLTYDNCRLPQAMLAAARRLEDQAAAERAIDALRWITNVQTVHGGRFRPAGTESFGSIDLPPHPFDQQPVDAWATVDAAALASRHTGDPHWQTVAQRAYAWFFGANDRALVLADPHEGACHDGLTPYGANLNRGAESVLALHLAAYGLASLQGGGSLPNDAGIVAPRAAG